MPANTHHISFVLIPRFNMLALMTLIEPMRIANYLAPEKLYTWDFRSTEPGDVLASNGLPVCCGALDPKDAQAPDTISLCASWGAETYSNPTLFTWLRRQKRQGKQLIGVEMATYVLAKAGILDGLKATTHWSMFAGLTETYPAVVASEQLYTTDHHLMTCAGGTSGLDMMLHFVGRQHGQQLATEIASQLMHHPHRPPEALQKITVGSLSDGIHPDVRAAMQLIEASIEEPLSVPRICRKIGISQRKLERLFDRDTGCTIVQFSKLVRLQYARVLLSTTPMTIRDVSVACGFNSMSYFSSCFFGSFGKKPSEYRQSWPENEPSPSWPGTVYSFIQNSNLLKTAR
ncbi:MAG: Carnitine catabolism transcriptional activator [Pseudomonadota bacterium]|jgi:transcriptional regulator GlxA family with amidase domain